MPITLKLLALCPLNPARGAASGLRQRVVNPLESLSYVQPLFSERNYMDHFKLCSNYAPAGDQPEAIDKLVNGIQSGKKEQILLGVTG